MNALGRKARSRSKPHLSTHPPPSSPPPPPTYAASQDDSSSHTQTPFINHGLQKWNADRLAWTSSRGNNSGRRNSTSVTRAQPFEEYDRDCLFDALITPSNQPLPRRVPLGELISVLQDVRERGD